MRMLALVLVAVVALAGCAGVRAFPGADEGGVSCDAPGEVPADVFAHASPTPVPEGTPESSPTPTPAPVQAPVTLPPASPGTAGEGSVTVEAQWSPEHGGLFGHVSVEQQDGRRYAAIEVGEELRLFHVRNEGPPEPTGVSIGPFPGYLRSVQWDDGLLAVWAIHQNSGAVLFYDVSDPMTPCLAGVYHQPSRFFGLDRGRAYLERRTDSGEYQTVVVTDPSRPQEVVVLPSLSRQSSDDPYYLWMVSDLTVEDGVAYVHYVERQQGKTVSRLALVDVSDLDTLRWIGEVESNGGRVYVRGDSAYILREDVGVEIVDVSDLERPEGRGRLAGDTPWVSSSTDPSEPGGLIVRGSRLYALMWGGDWGVNRWRLRIADVSDPENPRELGRFEGRGAAWGMWFQGQELVVVDSYGMSLLDVSNPEAVREERRVPSGAWPRGVFLRGDNAFLFLRSGMFVLALDDAGGAPELSAFRYFGPVGSVRMEGEAATVGIYGSYGSYRVDLSEPSAPEVGERQREELPPEGVKVGPYIYRALCGFVEVLSPADEAEQRPEEVAGVRLSGRDCGEEWGLDVSGDYAYVVGGGSLYVLGVSNPGSPVLLAEKPLASQAEGSTQAEVLVEGRYAYVLHGGLWALDISSAAEPREAAYFPTDALMLDVAGDRVALAGPGGAFRLLRLDVSSGAASAR